MTSSSLQPLSVFLESKIRSCFIWFRLSSCLPRFDLFLALIQNEMSKHDRSREIFRSSVQTSAHGEGDLWSQFTLLSAFRMSTVKLRFTQLKSTYVPVASLEKKRNTRRLAKKKKGTNETKWECTR